MKWRATGSGKPLSGRTAGCVSSASLNSEAELPATSPQATARQVSHTRPPGRLHHRRRRLPTVLPAVSPAPRTPACPILPPVPEAAAVVAVSADSGLLPPPLLPPLAWLPTFFFGLRGVSVRALGLCPTPRCALFPFLSSLPAPPPCLSPRCRPPFLCLAARVCARLPLRLGLFPSFSTASAHALGHRCHPSKPADQRAAGHGGHRATRTRVACSFSLHPRVGFRFVAHALQWREGRGRWGLSAAGGVGPWASPRRRRP